MFSWLRRRRWWLLAGCTLLTLALVATAVFLNRPSTTAPPPAGAHPPCPSGDEFAARATELAPVIFEGSSVTVRVDGAVTCAPGWAHADVSFDNGRAGWVVLRYVDGTWQWTVDDYWRQFGEDDELCTRLPDELRAVRGCAAATSAPPTEGVPDCGRQGVDAAIAADWDGVCVPGEFCGVDGLVRLSQGGAVTNSGRWGEAHIDVFSGEEVRGDVDGDGTDEVAVLLDCTTGSGLAAGRIARAYVVYVGGVDELRVLGVINGQQQEDGVLPTLFDKLELRPGTAVAHEVWFRQSDMTCCPTGEATTIWTLNAEGKLTPGEPEVTR
ncbi:hypothetical protein Ais01nite_80080 [Asanoa ishikariensis]|uniref:Uncharacterized protein n=1 Tax=Asanoa ishikariensis TaxID=137265 RepID=A0A1H3UXG0_9ACTN|nr:hypothetical protein [Asanoa ishikariensis]GIF69973.1 hypothetical protein Ais01nite_80080 [Asanoa ishikariensis]SDZ67103.1 hypothetical protein SAMN05421684_8349 [Asanoa ishikariensis]